MEKQIEQIPPFVRMGEKTSKSDVFDDTEHLTKSGGVNNLQAIKVYYDKEGIIGLVYFYKQPDQQFIKAMHNVPQDKKQRKKMEKRLLDIGPDDALKEIAGHFDKFLRRITFTTYRGKCINVGSDKGTPFTHSIPNHTFLVGAGSFHKYIDSLQFSVIPLAADFIAQFKPIQIGININHINNQPLQPSVKSYKGYFQQPTQCNNFATVNKFFGTKPVQQPQIQQNIQQQNPQQQQQPQYPQQPSNLYENVSISQYPNLFKK